MGIRPRSQRREGAEPISITNAPKSHNEDIHSRMIKYSVSMGIRFACILLVFVVDGWLRWVFVAGAVVLPYVAVVIANAGREYYGAPSTSLIDSAPDIPRPELSPTTTTADTTDTENERKTDNTDVSSVISGELIVPPKDHPSS